jgi:hypothetical protein
MHQRRFGACCPAPGFTVLALAGWLAGTPLRLDVQQTSVGLKADRPQRGQVMQPFADVEVPGVVDGRLGAQGRPMVLLDA